MFSVGERSFYRCEWVSFRIFYSHKKLYKTLKEYKQKHKSSFNLQPRKLRHLSFSNRNVLLQPAVVVLQTSSVPSRHNNITVLLLSLSYSMCEMKKTSHLLPQRPLPQFRNPSISLLLQSARSYTAKKHLSRFQCRYFKVASFFPQM